MKDKLTLRADGSGCLGVTVTQPSRCMMTSEVTQAQPLQWVMEPLLPSAGTMYEHKKFYQTRGVSC